LRLAGAFINRNLLTSSFADAAALGASAAIALATGWAHVGVDVASAVVAAHDAIDLEVALAHAPRAQPALDPAAARVALP